MAAGGKGKERSHWCESAPYSNASGWHLQWMCFNERGKRDHIALSLPLTAMLQAGICNGCVLMKGGKNESKLVLQTCLAFLGLASFVYLCSLCSRWLGAQVCLVVPDWPWDKIPTPFHTGCSYLLSDCVLLLFSSLLDTPSTSNPKAFFWLC